MGCASPSPRAELHFPAVAKVQYHYGKSTCFVVNSMDPPSSTKHKLRLLSTRNRCSWLVDALHVVVYCYAIAHELTLGAYGADCVLFAVGWLRFLGWLIGYATMWA